MIESKYVLEEGKEAPEGTEVIECTNCKKKFAVPVEMVKNITDKVCDVCAETVDKMKAAAGVAAMKTSDAAETISNALGK